MSASPYLNPATMDALIALDRAAMRDTCTITRDVPGTPNPDNSPGDGSQTVQTGVPCRFTQLRRAPAVEVFLDQRATSESEAVIRVPLGTDVLVTDTVAIHGVQYEIVNTNIDRTFSTSIKLSVRLLT